MNIDNYSNIEDLKKLSKKELEELASSIRDKIIKVAKTKKIHLSSNLGIVELTISLLKNFNLPNDKINYDTGHQSYIHKILTDRKDKIDKIRQRDGLSGFPDNEESIYDFISTGHSSNSLSISQGYIESTNSNNFLVTVIGDASISNGLAFEALNNISYNKTKMIIILNDNEMSISKNTGSLFKAFSKMKNTNFYFSLESLFINILKKTKLGIKICYKVFSFFNSIEKFIFGKNIFHNLNINYIGPIDGHNYKKIDRALKRAKWYSNKGPVIVHVKTKKGFGLEESNREDPLYHSIKFGEKDDNKTFSFFAANKLENILKDNHDIKIVNSAMTYSTHFNRIQEIYPNNYEDVGINEEHSVSKASGIVLANKKAIVCLYSTFLQRTYDQILHDVSRLKLPITFLIDRADISFSDGDTHHGIYDVGMLKSIPNTIITMPSSKFELNKLIDLSLDYKNGPFFIRYANASAINNLKEIEFDFGDWIKIQNKKSNICIISYGHYINNIFNYFKNSNVDIINAIFISGYNQKKILNMIKKYKKIIFYERIYKNGCLYYDILDLINKNNLNIKCELYCFKKSNIGIGTQEEIDKLEEMDIKNIKF